MLRFITYAAVTGAVSWMTVTGCQPSPASPQDAAEVAQANEDGMFCGGIAGIPCPDGYTCVDNPFDDCNPKKGGADCGGVCVVTPDCDAEGRDYVSTDPAMCARMSFWCPPGFEHFADSCGCGCEPTMPGEACGGNWCEPGQVCCNASCGSCVPRGWACSQIACQ